MGNGIHLASVHSEEENNFIVNITKSQIEKYISQNRSIGFWIGGILNSDLEPTWTDSQPVSCFNNNIHRDRPNAISDSGTLHLVIHHNCTIGKWNWQAGKYTRPFICKKGEWLDKYQRSSMLSQCNPKLNYKHNLKAGWQKKITKKPSTTNTNDMKDWELYNA